jgi:N-acyl-L-homoserine lactone synthetase
MKVKLISGHEAGKHPHLIDEMFKLRARVFKDRLNWEVNVVDGRERDRFDDLDPLYALAIDDLDRVVATFRLLQTTGPHMLADVFRELMPEGIPIRSPLIWESTRFAVDTTMARERSSRGLADVTGLMLTTLLETGYNAGLTHILTVLDVRMEKIIRRAGCPVDRLTEPKDIGGVPSLAILMECSEDTVAEMHRRNNVPLESFAELPSIGRAA